MSNIWKPKSYKLLTAEQRTEKLKKDAAYEIAVQNLSMAYYQKKRTVGVTAQEDTEYQSAKTNLWNDHVEWSTVNGLYEEVTITEQISNMEQTINETLANLNTLKVEAGQKELELKEKV